MHLRHRHRRWIALIALLSLLFQQVAMAAYLCPNESGRSETASMSAAMPACHANVTTDKARCNQHCAPLPPSSDHPPSPTVPTMLPATAWLPVAEARCSSGHVYGADIDARSTAPPLTIQHCTFQI
ncbi:MAG: hypothetical protein ABI843_10680 [Dokdonella sp.]